MKERLRKLSDIIFELIVFYTVYVMCFIGVSVGVIYKPLGIAGIIIAIMTVVIKRIKATED